MSMGNDLPGCVTAFGIIFGPPLAFIGVVLWLVL